MQRNNLRAQKVLSRCDATRHREIDPPAIADHAVDAPGPGAVESVFEDFEPFLAGGGCRGCVIYLGPEIHVSTFIKKGDRTRGKLGESVHVKDRRTLVRFRNRMVCVVCELCAADDVAPVHADFVAGLDGDDLAGDRGLEAGFACDVTVGDAVDCGAG